MPRRKVPVLHDRHRHVIDEYMANGYKRAEAMIAAGYSESTAKYKPHCVFGRDDVKAEIARRMAKHGAKLEITAERVLAELGKLAFVDLSNAIVREDDRKGYAYLDASLLTDDQVAALATFETHEYTEGRGAEARDIIRVRVKLSDKKGALDSLARHFGLFNDKLQVNGELSLVDRLQRGRDRVSRKRDGEHVDAGESDAVH